MRKPRIIKNRAGEQYGRLTIISLVERKNPISESIYKCVCTCGREKDIKLAYLLKKKTRSCGCLFVEHMAERNTTHGLSRNHKRTYRSWKDLRQRCNNPNNTDYPNYGGRGISVCKRWDSFLNFFEDMGERPDGMTIDRIDTNGNYEPLNCRWATPKEQARNKTNNRLMLDGKTLAEHCEVKNINHKVVTYRLSKGYSVKDSFSNKDFRIDEQSTD